MDQNAKKIMDQIEESSHISVDEIYNIAHSIQHEDLTDEATVRSLVRRLSRLAGRPISAGKEDEIVRSIINNEIPSSMEALQRFFGN
ncbi:stage VI sporulation protein F [Pseudogracilibacillus auburnensis]|uniref:stage VI sporulation protein F n=1 Tax=Pseudogracilibacillus auburnensis TaxID=1494959 RepID=UPI0027DA7753|nr:stage VI sporulation protein F [Pseudogracilibacillus auburnensis]